mgnify:CR=1 FL=1
MPRKDKFGFLVHEYIKEDKTGYKEASVLFMSKDGLVPKEITNLAIENHCGSYSTQGIKRECYCTKIDRNGTYSRNKLYEARFGWKKILYDQSHSNLLNFIKGCNELKGKLDLEAKIVGD